MDGHRYKFITVLGLSLSLLVFVSCARIKPVGHVNDKEFWDDFGKSFILLNPDEFRFFTFQNIDEFNKAPDAISAQGIQKWQSHFPQEPWPPDEPPQTMPHAKMPPKEKSGNYLRFLRDNIYTSAIWDVF